VRDEPTVQAAKSLFHTGCSTPCAGVPLDVPLIIVVFIPLHPKKQPPAEAYKRSYELAQLQLPRAPSAAPACVILRDVLLAV
jgi:hypothetical protein